MPRTVSRKTPKPTTAPDLDQWREIERHKSKMRNWLWLGTALFAVVVVSLWGWTWINRLSLIDWSAGAESNLIQSSKKEWEAIFTNTQEIDKQKELNAEQLRSALQKLKEQMASPTPSSTINTSTVTTTP